jgi:hypothetical protein
MKLLAKATPNKNYINLRSISDLILEAYLTKDDTVKFYESHTKTPDWFIEVKETTVQQLFEFEDKSENDIPFHKHENREFYVTLYREKYQTGFRIIKNKRG